MAWLFSIGVFYAIAQPPSFFYQKNQVQNGESVLLLMNNDCLRVRGESVKHNSSLDTSIQAYRVPYGEHQEYQNHACLIGMTNDQPVFASQLPNDPQLSNQTHLPSLGFSETQSMTWNGPARVNSRVVVAVIDSGIERAHPDLMNQLWQDRDGSIGYDFVEKNGQPQDQLGHGTHVSGLIAAETNNGLGIAAISRNSSLMVLRTLDATGSGSVSDVVNAIHYGVDHGAHVLNLSVDSSGANAAVLEALQYAASKNVVVVTAAGNQGVPLNSSNFYSPVSYASQVKGVLGVGALDLSTMKRANYSNYDNLNVKIMAPGSIGTAGIFSTYLGGTYKAFQGTSMATPIVTSAVALVVGFFQTQNITYTAETIESVMAMGSIQDPALTNDAQNGQRLYLPNLLMSLWQSFYLDGTGGYDDSL